MTNSKLKEAHKHSIYHRSELEKSNICGCFYCKSVFNPIEINEWTDQRETKDNLTALCPKCGIDSVLGGASGFIIDSKFLQQMYNHWF